ncbi:MAG: hypothetical protein NTZ74_15555 [Chloroflexi bacterium]|nr:hypothetical protein [Chloroflexota bacterium]
MQNTLIEQSFFSSGTLAVAIQIIIRFLCFGLVGNAVDSLFNRGLREPLQVVDNLLQFALENDNKTLSSDIVRSMYLGAMSTIMDLLPKNRRLILGYFDESMAQVDVLIDFSGELVKCATIYNQVTFCKQGLEAPRTLITN